MAGLWAVARKSWAIPPSRLEPYHSSAPTTAFYEAKASGLYLYGEVCLCPLGGSPPFSLTFRALHCHPIGCLCRRTIMGSDPPPGFFQHVLN